MKKPILLFITLFTFLTFVACDQKTNISTNNSEKTSQSARTTTTIPTNNTSQTTNSSTIITTVNTSQTTNTTAESTLSDEFLDVFFPNYPEDSSFCYAEIILYFSYPNYSPGDPNYNDVRHYYVSKNIEFFTGSDLDILGNFGEYYLSSYASFALLIYQSKRAFLSDLDLLKKTLIEGYTIAISVDLNTVGYQIDITEDTTLADITKLTEKYFNTEIHYNSLDYTVLDVSHHYVEHCSFDDYFYFNNTYIIDSYDLYLSTCSDNPLDIDEEFFIDKVLILIIFGHSASMTITGVTDLFYLDANTLEISIGFSALSKITTTDWQPTYCQFVISMNRYDLLDNTISKIHLHGTYLNGYLYDRPFHNSIDD